MKVYQKNERIYSDPILKLHEGVSKNRILSITVTGSDHMSPNQDITVTGYYY